MQTVADRSEASTAVRNNLSAIFVSLELSRSKWLITSLSPDGGEKMSKHVVQSGDVPGLLDRFSQVREKARMRTGKVFPFVVIQEAKVALAAVKGDARQAKKITQECVGKAL